MPRRRTGLLAGFLIAMASASVIACGGDSPLDAIPTPTTIPATRVVQPTAVAQVSPTVEIAPTAAPTAATGTQEYTVQAGDSLSAIAAQFGVTVDALIQANNITDPNTILVGQVLTIPAP
jgi:LysM repeat protein